MFFLFMSCNSDEKLEKIPAIANRAALAQLHATNITTVISDSGITRFRISTARWDVYDQAERPYWDFPNGIYFEKFDLNLKVDANIQSNTARFYENDQLWELKGKVRAMNLQGELFETEQLFWNQREERMYSDSLVNITRATQIISGTGFESDQSLSKYVFRKVKGIFPINENEK